ncbi:MAG: endo-1,4-beta-xylanase [Bacteroidales bacterium]|nr:endo-1,4-beta-xylanase [Bacteroidales bacterium]
MRVNTFLVSLIAILTISSCGILTKENPEQEIIDELQNKFYFGTALNEYQLNGTDTIAVKVVKRYFNSVVAENVMKSEVIHPLENRYDFTESDKFIDFAQANNMYTVGHCLIWHSQCAPWFFVDSIGNQVTKDELINRIKEHVYTIVSRYKGKVNCWDVCNEIVDENGNYRNSKFYEILGTEYISLAFTVASEADPEAELLLNDYDMANPKKRAKYIEIVNMLRDKGIKISGIGMQSHTRITTDLTEWENSIIAFRLQGLDVHITELDLTVLPIPTELNSADVSMREEYKEEYNPYKNFLPDSIQKIFDAKYFKIFDIAAKNGVKRVTLWGVNDGWSWRNDWPIDGRTDYPLLFDRVYRPKPILYQIAKSYKNLK